MGLRIRTKDKELFSKINALNYTDEVLINASKKQNVSRILRNINKDEKNIGTTQIGDRILLTRLKPLNINLYHVKRR